MAFTPDIDLITEFRVAITICKTNNVFKTVLIQTNNNDLYF